MGTPNPYYLSKHWRALRQACFRRDGYRCIVQGCVLSAKVADHIEPRPHVPFPSPADRLDNLRSLCLPHDAQVKEKRRGLALRKQSGVFRVRGCDADGWPIDPRFNRG